MKPLQPAALGLLMAMILAPSGICATGTTKPGQLQCSQLRQNCLVHAQKLATVKTQGATQAAASPADAASSRKMTGATCEKLFADAQDTGVWAAYKGFPAVNCAK